MFKALIASLATVMISVFSIVSSSALAAPGGGGGPNSNLGEVDCGAGGTIGDALVAGATVITVTGTCNESVVISQHGIVLNGGATAILNGDGSGPAITVTGDNASIESWAAINGGVTQHGIVVRASGSAIVQDVASISGNDGIVVTESAFAEVINSTVDGSFDDGMTVATNGSARISGSSISNNTRHGIVVAGSGAIILAGENTVESNVGTGVFVSGGQVTVVNANNVVQSNPGFDINCFRPSRILIFDSITSSTNDIALNDCRLIEAFNGISVAPVFVDHPLNLVDCTATPPDSIARALANGVTNVVIRGLCDEHVAIRTSNVTIRGENLDGGGNPVDGIDTDFGPGTGRHAISVDSSQGVQLVNLKISGGRNGVTAFFNSGVHITNSEIAPFYITDGRRFGVTASDNTFVRLRNSHVKDGGVLAVRGSSLRLDSTIVKADIGGGDTSQIAVDVFGASVAQFRGATIEGTVLLNSNAVLQVLDSFLAIPFDPTVINSTSPTPITCQNFSSITQPPNTLVDAFFVPLTEDDVSIAEIARNVPSCTLTGF